MSITRILIDEHRVIEQVLNCLERMAERCEFHHKLESDLARDAIAFLRGFIEQCHDCKIETHLLPTLREMGVSAEEVVECPMRQSREDARPHLDAMEAAIQPAHAGSPAALAAFAEHARAYIDVLLDSITRQEDCLFLLTSKRARTNEGTLPHGGDGLCRGDVACAAYVELAHRLAEQFGVTCAALAEPEVGTASKLGKSAARVQSRDEVVA
jgi:hemerythrin-like domain-containing protein